MRWAFQSFAEFYPFYLSLHHTPQPHVPTAAFPGPSAWPLDCVRCLDFQNLDPPACRAPHRL
jgi:hypothetical protein